jgi:hypothetical protein
MSREAIPISEVQQGLSPLVGIERARQLITEAVGSAGVGSKLVYPPDEMALIFAKLKEQGGLIAAVVSAMSVRILHS